MRSFSGPRAWHRPRYGERMRLALTALTAALVVLSLTSIGCSAEVTEDVADDSIAAADSSEEGLTGSQPVGTELVTTAAVNFRTGPSTSSAVIRVLPAGTRVASGSATPQNGFYGITTGGRTGWVHGAYLRSGTATGGTPDTTPPAGTISSRGQDQMRRIVPFADANHSGASRGRCFQYVWGYLWKSGYGDINEYNDAPDMGSAEARMFAEYMNRGTNAARWGLQRLPLTNPYDAPRGAVVVVAAGSPGTAHPTAGDIAIAAGGGRFINDGPNMGYGGSRDAFTRGGGRVLGIYVPR